MYTLTVTRDSKAFRFCGRDLAILISQAAEYDTAVITDPDGDVIYELSFPLLLQAQAC